MYLLENFTLLWLISHFCWTVLSVHYFQPMRCTHTQSVSRNISRSIINNTFLHLFFIFIFQVVHTSYLKVHRLHAIWVHQYNILESVKWQRWREDSRLPGLGDQAGEGRGQWRWLEKHVTRDLAATKMSGTLAISMSTSRLWYCNAILKNPLWYIECSVDFNYPLSFSPGSLESTCNLSFLIF